MPPDEKREERSKWWLESPGVEFNSDNGRDSSLRIGMGNPILVARRMQAYGRKLNGYGKT